MVMGWEGGKVGALFIWGEGVTWTMSIIQGDVQVEPWGARGRGRSNHIM